MNTLEKEFVPYKQALALKELGFDEPCFANYTVIPEDEIDWFTIPEQGITDKTSFGSSKNYNSKSFEEEGTISAPTFSQSFRWFREKYNLKDKYGVFPHHTIMFNYIIGGGKEEEAELGCLIKLIEIVKEKKNG